MSSNGNGSGGFLLEFLKNNTNTTTADNSTFNETINTTINTTDSTTLSFLTSAVFDNSTNSSIISIDASEENITVDSIVLFTSYDNANFTEAGSLTNTSLPTTITVPVDTSYSELYYYVNVEYNNATYRVPENGTEILNISTQ
jgi:hypothetical protein